MKIVQRLYLADFLRLLLLISVGISFLFSLADLVGRLDDFPPGKLSPGAVASITVLNLPRYFVYLLPMAILVCSLFTFSQAFRRREITAVIAAGGRVKHLASPFLFLGILLAAFSFLTGEFIVPRSLDRLAEIKTALEGRDRKSAVAGGAIWLRARDGSPVRIDLYFEEGKAARWLTVFVFGKEFLKEKIVAERAVWDGTAWMLGNVTRYDTDSGEITKLPVMRYENLEGPDVFAREMKKPDAMGITELYRFMDRLSAAGFTNKKLVVDLNAKISFPVINVFMMLIGISLSARGRTGGGLFSAGLGLLISLGYWLGFSLSLSMGYAGILPAALAAWVVPVLFAGFSVSLFMRVPE